MSRWQKASGSVFLFFFLIFLTNGCVRKPPPPPKITISSASAIIQALENRKKRIQDLKALAHISLASPDRKFSAKQAIILRKPHYLRVETLSFFGYPILYLFADGRQISFYDPKENKLFRGSSQLDNIFKLTGIALEISEIITILCGDVPLNSNITRPELRFEPENTLYSLRLRPYEVIKLGAVDLLPRQYQLAERPGETYNTSIEVSYQQYEKINDLLFPFNIQIKLPKMATTVTIKYSEVKFNQSVPTSSFELPRLEGVEMIDLGGGWPYEKR